MWIEIAIVIYDIIHTFLSIFGCFLNAFLIYLALYRTPNLIKQYTTLVLNFAITDFCTCFAELSVQQRVIATGRTIGFVSNGFCTYIGPFFCFASYTVMSHLFIHNLWSLLLSFSYRYYILFYPAPSRRTISLILLLIYIPSLFEAIVFLFSYDDPTIIKSILKEKYPNYDLENKTISGTVDIFAFPSMYSTLHSILPATPIYIALLVLRRKIKGSLESKGKAISKNTKHMHSQLLKALTYQAALPLLYLITVLCFLLGQLDIIHHPTIESYLILMLFISLLSPVSYFIFVKPYRDFIFKLLGKQKIQVNRTWQSTVVNSSQTWNS